MVEYLKYSVLMSVYIKEKPEWFRISLDAILSQTIMPAEIVLVKDGPLTEELEKVITEYSQKSNIFKIISLEKNVGLGLALQKGITLCSNELIARMDTDDYCIPKRCERILDEFNKNPKLDVVGSWENEFWEDDISNIFACHKVPETDIQIKHFMRRRCGLLHPTVIFKKSSVLKAGNYRNVPLFEDYDLFVRMIRNNANTYNIQEALYYLRVNPNLFKRRGGYTYMKTSMNFRYWQWKNGSSSFFDYVVSTFGQMTVCLMPNFFRTLFYKKFLRRN